MAKVARLDRAEQSVESMIETFVPVQGERRSQIDSALAAARKSRNINIRIAERDLSLLRERATREGVPYQTLITSVLHRYVSDRLVDEESIRRTLVLLAETDQRPRRTKPGGSRPPRRSSRVRE